MAQFSVSGKESPVDYSKVRLAPPPPSGKARPKKASAKSEPTSTSSSTQRSQFQTADILGLGIDVSDPKQSQASVESVKTRPVSTKRSQVLKTKVGHLTAVLPQPSTSGVQAPSNQSALDKAEYFRSNPQSLMNIVNEDPRLNTLIKSASTLKGRWQTNKRKLSFWLGKLPVLSIFINMKKALRSRSQMQGSKRLDESSTNPLTKQAAQGLSSHKRQQKNSKTVSTGVGILVSGVSGGTDGGLGGLATEQLTGVVSQGIETASNALASKGASTLAGKKTSRKTKETHHDSETLRIGHKPQKHVGTPESYQTLKDPSPDDFEQSSHALDDSYMMRAFSDYLSPPSMLDDPQGMSELGIDPEVEEARVALKDLLGSPPTEDLLAPDARKMTPVDRDILQQLQVSGHSSSKGASYKPVTDIEETLDTHQISELRVFLLLDGQIT